MPLDILYVFKQLSHDKISKVELSNEIREIITPEKGQVFMNLINSVYDDKLIKRVKLLTYRTAALTVGLSRFTGVTWMLDQRATQNEDGEFVEKTPIVALEIHYYSKARRDSTTIHLTPNEVEYFVKELNEAHENAKRMPQ